MQYIFTFPLNRYIINLGDDNMTRPYFENKPQKVFISHRPLSYTYESHFHSFAEIAYCFSGVQHVKIGEELYTLKSGDAAIIFPNTVHEYISETENASSTESVSVMCNLNFLSETFPEFITSVPETPIILSAGNDENLALAFRKTTLTQNQNELIGWTYIILSSLFNQLILLPKNDHTELSLPALITSYINDNFPEPLSIEFLAKKFGYSPSHIAHIFCNQLKIPFKTYLNMVRCDFAENKIMTTKKSITEIAHLSGYNSLNTFCRCFKSHTGLTPSAFKKNQQAN